MESKKKWDIVAFRVSWGKSYRSDNHSDIIVKMPPYALSIFFRSEYLISLFFAAARSTIFTSLRAIPCTEDTISIWFCLTETLKTIECNRTFRGWF